MANELIRVVATVRVKSIKEGFDADQLADDVGEYLAGTAIRNADLEPFDNDYVGRAHVHVSTSSSNCQVCIEHAMDEMS